MLGEPLRPIPEEARVSPDYYLRYTPRQPKREIADYAEASGILVPQRFASLNEALSSGKSFLVRSEHPQDYNGASDLATTVAVNPDHLPGLRTKYPMPINWEELRRQGAYAPTRAVIATAGLVDQSEFEDSLKKLDETKTEWYCRWAGVDLEAFREAQSYSYWGMLPGINRAIVADSAIKGKYYIFSQSHTLRDGFMLKHGYGYTIIDNGQVIADQRRELPAESIDDIEQVIKFYEDVRHLGRFDPNQVPIIEGQTVDGRNHFLQYLRTVGFQQPTFSLDREPERDEVEAFLVRGATRPDGMEVNLAIHYGYDTVPGEDGAVDWNAYPPFTEAFIRNRKLQLISFPTAAYLGDFSNGHQPRSLLFKAEMSAVLLEKPYKKLTAGAKYTTKNTSPQIKIRVISDGRKAYLKRLD